MLKKALVAAALLSVSATSVTAYAAQALSRGAPSLVGVSNDDDDNTALYVLLGLGAAGGLVLALDSDGSNSPE